MVADLHNDLVLRVLEFLHPAGLACAEAVNLGWRACVEENLLWRRLCLQLWGLTGPQPQLQLPQYPGLHPAPSASAQWKQVMRDLVEGGMSYKWSLNGASANILPCEVAQDRDGELEVRGGSLVSLRDLTRLGGGETFPCLLFLSRLRPDSGPPLIRPCSQG